MSLLKRYLFLGSCILLIRNESLRSSIAPVLWLGEQHIVAQALKLFGHVHFTLEIQIKVFLNTDYVETDGTFPKLFLVNQFSD